MPKTPSYRKREGRSQAIVTLTDSVTKKRRDYWLGQHGTPESREQYHRIIAEWEANGRRLPRPTAMGVARCKESEQLLLVILLRDFYRFAKRHFDVGEFRSFLAAMRLMRKYYGRTPATEFGPKKLRLLRELMIRGDGQLVEPQRSLGE